MYLLVLTCFMLVWAPGGITCRHFHFNIPTLLIKWVCNRNPKIYSNLIFSCFRKIAALDHVPQERGQVSFDCYRRGNCTCKKWFLKGKEVRMSRTRREDGSIPGGEATSRAIKWYSKLLACFKVYQQMSTTCFGLICPHNRHNGDTTRTTFTEIKLNTRSVFH